MTAETDLLPMPERFSFMEWETHMRTYARANVAHAIAPLQAEIEALRADLEETMDGRDGEMRARLDAEARAERLAEALRVAEAALADIGDADREPGDDVAWCERRARLGLRVVRAALHPTAAQEEGND